VDTSKIKIGCSGYYYANEKCDWRGVFYPHHLRGSEYLTYYAEHFDLVELNSTFYRLMSPEEMYQIIDKAMGRFEYSVKAYRELTHKTMVDSELFKKFRDSLEPIKERRQLGAVLVQFPQSFRNTLQNLYHLQRFRKEFSDYPLVIEFRNKYWLQPSIFKWLEQNDVAFCCVDEPRLPNLLPPEAKATSRKLSYVRFHGRNAKAWYQHGDNPHLRYDWDYTDDELKEWFGKISELTKGSDKVFILMNNCYDGHSIKNAKRLKELLKTVDSGQ